MTVFNKAFDGAKNLEGHANKIIYKSYGEKRATHGVRHGGGARGAMPPPPSGLGGQ